MTSEERTHIQEAAKKGVQLWEKSEEAFRHTLTAEYRITGRFSLEWLLHAKDNYTNVCHALLEAEADFAITKAEIERLRALAEEAYYEGLRDQAQHPSVDGFQLWDESDAKRALEVTT